jgi:hypothetical protein
VALVVTALLTSCGLPGDGTIRRVDDDTVPYRLLDPADPSATSAGAEPRPGRVPVVYWLTGERLTPEATGDDCDDDPDALVDDLLAVLAAGPSEEARATGRSSAVPPEAGLRNAGVADGTVRVEVEFESSLSAERLPVAVGQVVLTLTSAPTIGAVEFVADGEPVSVPVPGGALTDSAVTASDYLDLLPDRFRAGGTAGCPPR